MSDAVEAGGRTIEISHADRVLFGEAGATKLDLARHYVGVATRWCGRASERRRRGRGLASSRSAAPTARFAG